MEYPVWEPFISNYTTIALMVVMYAFISHFAVGGGLFLVLAEIFARRMNDPVRLARLHLHGRIFLLVTALFGAAGVGIWITIGLIKPAAAWWFFRNFLWGWASVWMIFLVEIAAILVYCFGWKRLSPKHHLIVGWIYFFAAWLSLTVVNGILAFMLTPGKWIASGNFCDGFFNPTFWPSLIFRTFACLTLAGLYATVTAAREKDKNFKVRSLRIDGLLILASIILAVPAGYWYINALPPQVAAGLVPGAAPYTAMQMMTVAAGLLAFLTLMGTVFFPRHWGYVTAGILLLGGLLSLGAFEWMCESLRRPFIVSDFLNRNGLQVPGAVNLPATQWSPLVMFAATFAVGLIVMTWMLRTYFAKSAPDQNQ